MSKIVILKNANLFPPRKREARLNLDRVSLKDGSNFLSDEQFNKVSRHPLYQALVERKALVVQEPQSEVEPVPLSEVPANLSGYNVEEADDIIDNTYDLDVLKRWLSAETRKTTRDDLNRRIKDIEGGDA